jgi:ribose transport system substrate-binding protein
MRRSIWSRVTIVLVGSLLAAGCGSSDDDGGETTTGEAFRARTAGGIPGALLPEERKLWRYDKSTGKFEVVDGDASKPYKPSIQKFEPGTTIGYIDPWASNPFAIPIRNGFNDLAKRYGFEVISCDADFKADKAIECAEQLVAQRPDFIHVGNWQAGAAKEIMRRLDEARIPSNSNDVAHPNNIFIGADNYTAGVIGGRAGGRYAQKTWSCEDVWVFLGEDLAAGEAPDLRISGFADGIQEICGKLPEDQIQRQRMAEGTGDEALTITTDWLTAHPQAKHVLSVTLGDEQASGIAKAITQARRDGFVVGMTCDPVGVATVRQARPSENHFLGCVAFFPERYPELIVSTAQDVLEGKPVPNEVHVEHKFLDHDNVDEYYPR